MDRKFMRNGLLMLLLVVGTAALLFTWLNSSTAAATKPYGKFLNSVAAGEIKTVEQEQQVLTVTPNAGEKYTVVVPTVLTNVLEDMEKAATGAGREFDRGIYGAKQAPDTSWIGLLLTGLLPLLVIGGFIYFMMRQAQGTNNQALSFGKSRARMFLGNKTVVTFADVAGVDEAKTELQEVVEFLKYPEKFNSLGAR
ncbi:MAG TPA: ATP-dependent metallopeptidase FtsH/Yme1/Tma family protein, partial [Candidatus Polarisedimenticolia bacterium]|nr:ATP-dependent metallopeptidase FtsH/Yme1/Tma family protein [Candidatus Polarisedimenticolia bacterium]